MVILRINLYLVFIIFANICFADEFIVFDSTLYKNDSYGRTYGIPNALSFNMEILETMYAGDIWINSRNLMHSPPSEAVVNKSVHHVRKKFGELTINNICLDIEHWDTKEKDNNKLKENISKYINTIKMYKEKMPTVNFGFYSMLPIRNYYDALKEYDSRGHKKWIEQNKKLSLIGHEVDIIFPSLYTFNSNREDWVKYAIENIKEAKKYNKPVYPYIWPQYHVSSDKKLEFIAPEFWNLQLHTIREHADGVVIWGGWDHISNKQLEWDDNADWWKVLKEFLSNLEENE